MDYSRKSFIVYAPGEPETGFLMKWFFDGKRKA
jgi:hypothetical protein